MKSEDREDAAEPVTPPRLHHDALRVDDLERMSAFYTGVLGGSAGPRYENPTTGFRSYFVAFPAGRIELMWQAGRTPPSRDAPVLGYAHVALSVGGRAAVIRSLLWVGGSEDPDPCETGQPSKPVESRTRAQIQEDERRAKSGAALAVEPGQWIKAGERPHYMKPEKVLPPDTEPMKPEDLPVYPPRGATEPATQVIEPPSLSDPSHSIPRVESVPLTRQPP